MYGIIQIAGITDVIVTSSIEQKLNSEVFMIAGIGDFDDRYFATIRKGTKYGQV